MAAKTASTIIHMDYVYGVVGPCKVRIWGACRNTSVECATTATVKHERVWWNVYGLENNVVYGAIYFYFFNSLRIFSDQLE